METAVRMQIAAEADEWLLQLQTSPDAHREHFTDWLLRSPAHIEAYLEVSRTWHELAIVAEGRWSSVALIAAARAEGAPGNVVSLREAAGVRFEPKRTKTGWSRPWSVAAALLLALA